MVFSRSNKIRRLFRHWVTDIKKRYQAKTYPHGESFTSVSIMTLRSKLHSELREWEDAIDSESEADELIDLALVAFFICYRLYSKSTDEKYPRKVVSLDTPLDTIVKSNPEN